MRPQEALDHRMDLLARLSNPVVRRVWAQQLSLDAHVFGDNSQIKRELRRDVDSNSAATIKSLCNSTREFEVFHVSSDLTSLTVFAASQLSEADCFDQSLIPTRCGLVRFEDGLPFVGIRGKKLKISWLAWGPILAGSNQEGGEPEEITVLWMWNDHYDEPDDIALALPDQFLPTEWDAISRNLGRWGFIGSEMLFHGAKLGPAWIEISEERRAQIFSENDVPHEHTNVIRYIHAFFLLLSQKVTSSQVENPDRARRKRAMRAGLPPRVTVVTLRNVESQRSPGESLVEWSHRWVVRGFWRWQVCGSGHPLAQELVPGKWRARIWVAPFVKEPQDKPLIVSEKVYAVHR